MNGVKCNFIHESAFLCIFKPYVYPDIRLYISTLYSGNEEAEAWLWRMMQTHSSRFDSVPTRHENVCGTRY